MSRPCELEIPSVQGLPENVLSVGRIFHLKCMPDSFFNIEGPNYLFVLPKEYQKAQPPIFKVLDFRWDNPQTLLITGVSYQVGQFEIPDFSVHLGEKDYSIGAIKFEVQSVIENPQEQKDPYGPIGPLKLAYPMFLWIILASLILVFLGQIIRIWLRRRQRQKLIESLLRHESPASPMSEFFSFYRSWQRKFYDLKDEDIRLNEAAEKIEHAFKLFLTRSFRVPAFEWSAPLVWKEILKQLSSEKNEKNQTEQLGKKVKSLLKEFKGFRQKNILKSQDVRQLLEESSQICQALDSYKKAKKEIPK